MEGATDNWNSGDGAFGLSKPVKPDPAAVEARSRPWELACVNIGRRDQDKNKAGTNRRLRKRDSDSRRKRVESSRKRRQCRGSVNRSSRPPLPTRPKAGPKGHPADKA